MNNILFPHCPVCGNTDAKKHIFIERRDSHRRLQCFDCESIYFCPTPEKLPEYDLRYNLEFYRPSDMKHAGIMAEFIVNLARKYWDNPRILEAGVGNGLTQLLIQETGTMIHGVDIDPKLTEYLQKRYGTTVRASRFEDYVPEAPYNLIYSSHVIEHTQSPKVFINKAFNNLTEDGILVIETPDIAYMYKAPYRWHHLATRSLFEHTCLLSQKGLKILGENAGFDIINIETSQKYESQRAIMKKHTQNRPVLAKD